MTVSQFYFILTGSIILGIILGSVITSVFRKDGIRDPLLLLFILILVMLSSSLFTAWRMKKILEDERTKFTNAKVLMLEKINKEREITDLLNNNIAKITNDYNELMKKYMELKQENERLRQEICEPQTLQEAIDLQIAATKFFISNKRIVQNNEIGGGIPE